MTNTKGYYVFRDGSWVRETVKPAVVGPYRRAPEHFEVIETPPIVKVKPYGMETPVEAIVHGASRSGELLIELPMGAARYGHPIMSWITAQADQTAEGRRFVRTVVRVMKVLARLGREAGKTRATKEKLAERAAERAGRDGACQICENRQIIHNGTLVLHGYERPGIGYAVGQCFGYHHKPWEVACDALREWIEIHLTAMLTTAQESVAYFSSGKVKTLTIMVGSEFVDHCWLPKNEQITPKDARFPKALAVELAAAKSREAGLMFEIKQQRARLASWKPDLAFVKAYNKSFGVAS